MTLPEVPTARRDVTYRRRAGENKKGEKEEEEASTRRTEARSSLECTWRTWGVEYVNGKTTLHNGPAAVRIGPCRTIDADATTV